MSGALACDVGGLKMRIWATARLAEFSWRCVAEWREAIPTNAEMHSTTTMPPGATFPVRCANTGGA